MAKANPEPSRPLLQAAGLFLKLGIIAFGRPAVHVAMDGRRSRTAPIAATSTATISFGLWPLFRFFLKVGSVRYGSFSSSVLLYLRQRPVIVSLIRRSPTAGAFLTVVNVHPH
jgi:hypothetical protein